MVTISHWKMNMTKDNNATGKDERTYTYNFNNYGDYNYSDGLPPIFPIPENVLILDKVLNQFLLPATCIGGIVGTLLTVVVLTRKNMCTSTNSYLKALAVTDLLFLTLLSVRLMEPHLSETNFYDRFHIALDYILIFLSFLNLVSIWLTVMLSIDRYIAICHPFRAVAFTSVFRARMSILVTYIVMFVFGLPKFWEIKVEYYPETGPYTTVSELTSNTEYILGYRIFYEGIMCVILPFMFLIAINTRLIQEIRKSTRYNCQNLGTASAASHMISAEQLQLTMMFVGITLVFFLCQAPYLIFTILSVVFSSGVSIDYGPDVYIAYIVVRPITLMLIGVKSASNFLLYCWFSEKFRITLRRLLCRKFRLSQPQQRRQSNNSHNNRRNSNHISRETTC